MRLCSNLLFHFSRIQPQDGTRRLDETGRRDETEDTAGEDGVVAAVAVVVVDLENSSLSPGKPF